MIYKKIIAVFFFISFISTNNAQNFAVEGNSLRNTVVGSVNAKKVLFNSELDGSVSCYTLDGKKIWRNPTQSPAVLFEIEAADVNADGNDDLLGASGDGNIYCWDSKGSLLWKFNPGYKVRFSEMAVVKGAKGVQIFAGGNDSKLYELNSLGKLVSSTPIKGIVRKIEVGNFTEVGKPSIFLMTYAGDKFNWEFMGFIDPITKSVLKTNPFNSKGNGKEWNRLMITDISVADIDKDKRDDVLFFGAAEKSAIYIALNGDFKIIGQFEGPVKDAQRYAHVIGTSLQPIRNEIALQFGGIIYVCSPDGKLIDKSGTKNAEIIYNDMVVDAVSKKLFCAGQVGGDNSMYTYSLSKNDWYTQKQTFIGRAAEVEKNINALYNQAVNFKLPAYQKPSEKPWVIISGGSLTPEVKKLKAADLIQITQYTWQENTDRTNLVNAFGKDALKKDRRGKYDKSRAEIITLVKALEAKGEAFTLWAGHGTDPFYLQIETLEAVLKAAPTTCYGFTYAEMANVEDPRVIYFIKEYVPRLAAACRVNGRAKLFFRYKNMFWAATSHMEPWKSMFFSGKYSDVLVPASEDTSSRTQDINLVGRVGMFAGGYVNDFAMRLIDDNPTSWRPLSPGGQRSASPYLRQGVMMAAYGARYGVLFDNKYFEGPGLNIMYALMKSGALPVVNKEDILSIGSWHLIDHLDEELIESVDNHHDMTNFSTDDDKSVFSVAHMHWAGASLPDYDFSKAALGVNYRWLNYMPELPFGMIPIVPSDYKSTLDQKVIPYSVSNLKNGKVDGKIVAAKDFGATIKSVAEQGARKLLVNVKGAAWSAIRIDDNHIRVILIDPGYIDPQDRQVSVTFNQKQPLAAVDILSKESLKIADKSIKLTVPAGSMRFVDMEY